MKRISFIFVLTLFVSAVNAQVKTIKPTSISPMPTISFEEYERLFDMSEGPDSDKVTPKQREALETCGLYDDLYMPFCSWYCGGEVLSVKASNYLKPQGKFTYEGKNAHDFNHKSVWATDGNGVGASLVYEFAGKNPRITTVKILNGHVKTEKAWRENSRVKRLKVYYMDKPYAILELEDSRTLQEFEVGVLGPHSDTAPNWTLKFEILEIYPGTKYQDTVIAELYFDGIDVH